MTALRFDKTDLKQLSQSAAFCGAPTIGVSSGSMAGSSTIDGILPLVPVLGVFLIAGMWMFRRWGKYPEAQAPPGEPSPEAVAGTRQDRELVNA